MKTNKTNEKTAAENPEKPVNPKNMQLLQENEAVISKAQSSFLEIGKALKAIRDQKLFAGTEYVDFEAYCIKKWCYSQSYANRLIAAHDCYELLKKELSSSGEVLPINEYQLRALSGLTDNKWVKTWKQVLANAAGKPVTGEMVEAVVNNMLSKSVAAKPKTAAKQTETPAKTVNAESLKKLAEIGKLVEKALKNPSTLTVGKLTNILKKIQTLVAEKAN
jgi:propanediol dehydratase large subunit